MRSEVVHRLQWHSSARRENESIRVIRSFFARFRSDVVRFDASCAKNSAPVHSSDLGLRRQPLRLTANAFQTMTIDRSTIACVCKKMLILPLLFAFRRCSVVFCGRNSALRIFTQVLTSKLPVKSAPMLLRVHTSLSGTLLFSLCCSR